MSRAVLTVDDSKVVRTIVGRYLKPFGVDVLEAENGQVGLAMAQEHHPQLILLDYNMPVMDGFKTLESLKQDTNLREIPVIMLTTEAVADTVMKLIKLGLKNYITKPFSRVDLLKKVNMVLHLYEGDEVPSEEKMFNQMLMNSCSPRA
jgi:CheY-like chemotaxis protein